MKPDPTPADAASGPIAFDRQAFDTIARILPPDRLAAHLASFAAQLRKGLGDPNDGDAVMAVAHRLVSQAGMLGFRDLSDRCRVLEETGLAGEPIEPALDAVRIAMDQALVMVGELAPSSGA